MYVDEDDGGEDGGDASNGLLPDHEVAENVAEVGGPLSSLKRKCPKTKWNKEWHNQFYSVSEFGEHHLKDLLPELEPSEVVSWVKGWAHMVVRLRGAVISNHRPDVTKDGEPYPFADKRGQHVSTLGSGFVSHMTSLLCECQCEKCNNSLVKEKECWLIGIQTACHVVFDEVEAKECEVTFFDDSPNQDNIVTLKGCITESFMFTPSSSRDFSMIKLFTHDKQFAHKLKSLFDENLEKDDKMKESIEIICDDVNVGIDARTQQTLDHFHINGSKVDAKMFKSLKEDYECSSSIDICLNDTVRVLHSQTDHIGLGVIASLKRVFEKVDSSTSEIKCKLKTVYEHHNEIDFWTKNKVKDDWLWCELRNRIDRKALVEFLETYDSNDEDAKQNLKPYASNVRNWLIKFKAENKWGGKHKQYSTSTLIELYDEFGNVNVQDIQHRLNKLIEMKSELLVTTQACFEEYYALRIQLLKSITKLIRNHVFYKLPVFVISHPHGTMQHITCGLCTDRNSHSFLYTTPTCSGSSGGLVLPLWPKMNTSFTTSDSTEFFQRASWSSIMTTGRRSVTLSHSGANRSKLGYCADGFTYKWGNSVFDSYVPSQEHVDEYDREYTDTNLEEDDGDGSLDGSFETIDYDECQCLVNKMRNQERRRTL